MAGIDAIPPAAKPGTSEAFSMVTDQSILIVTKDTIKMGKGRHRPTCMHQGSFLVFRKLEQNADAFHELCEQNYSLVVCDESGHTKFPFSSVILSWGELG
jgi:hypothetical protein